VTVAVASSCHLHVHLSNGSCCMQPMLVLLLLLLLLLRSQVLLLLQPVLQHGFVGGLLMTQVRCVALRCASVPGPLVVRGPVPCTFRVGVCGGTC
jgi:hypothetical protein